MTSSLRTIMGEPPSTIAPIANSGSNGTPILRTKIKSSGASSAEATSAATGTPPRGKARTTGSWPRYPASAAANFRPASARFLNGIVVSVISRRRFRPYLHRTNRAAGIDFYQFRFAFKRRFNGAAGTRA